VPKTTPLPFVQNNTTLHMDVIYRDVPSIDQVVL